MNFLSIDAGTTCCKCQLFDESGAIKAYLSREYSLKITNEGQYADVSAIVGAVFDLIRRIAAEHPIDSVCFSSFGETFVALDRDGRILFDPMLYTDPRGGEEAKEIAEIVDADDYFSLTGVSPHAMYSASKLMWLKKHRPAEFSRIDRVLLIGDYLGYLLTGKAVIDYSLAARTGLFDVTNMRFDAALCEKLGFNAGWFSRPERAGTVVGEVIRRDLLPEGCLLVLGAHDQVCTALGAGITGAGEAVDGLGTVECITAVHSGGADSRKMRRAGICRVPYAFDGLYCSYIVTYSCGSVIKWFRDELLHRYTGGERDVYSYLEKRMPDRPSDLFLLPLFAGSMIPHNDLSARGALIGLSTSTTDGEIYRAIMEGLALEMRYETAIAAECGIEVRSAVATGGGANSAKWLQIKADIQRIPFSTLRSAEGGLCGCALLQATALGKMSVGEAKARFVRTDRIFTPGEALYEEKYRRYIKLYDHLREFY